MLNANFRRYYYTFLVAEDEIDVEDAIDSISTDGRDIDEDSFLAVLHFSHFNGKSHGVEFTIFALIC